MLNFTIEPVQSSILVREIGFEQIPYFRTPEFSEIMFENECLIRKFADIDKSGRVVFLTASGSAAMEAAVINVFTEKDKVLIVNGGSFGQRFVDICKIYGIPYTEIKLEYGQSLTENHLKPFENKCYTGFLVNMHETSTGVLYDLKIIGNFCKRNNLFLIVDAISSFLADPFSMIKYNAQIMLTSSQKALACPPGISVIVMSEKAVERIYNNNPKCLYLDLKSALKNGERGQTPFTPAVSILLQINARLKEIDKNGGEKSEIKRISSLAEDFRNKIKNLPLRIFAETPSNAITSLCPKNVSAHSIFTILKKEYNIWICPNGGDLADKVFRVGHIGDLTKDDNTVLVNALLDLQKRGLL